MDEDQIKNEEYESSSGNSEKNSNDDEESTGSSETSADNNHLITEVDNQQSVQIQQTSAVEADIINVSSDSNANDSVDDKEISNETDAKSQEYDLSTLQQFDDLSNKNLPTLSENIQENESELEVNDNLYLDDVESGSQDGIPTLPAQTTNEEEFSVITETQADDTLNIACIPSADASITGDSTFLTASDANMSDAIDTVTADILNDAVVENPECTAESMNTNIQEDATVSVKEGNTLSTGFAIEEKLANNDKVAVKNKLEIEQDEPMPSTSRMLRNTRSKSREPERQTPPNRALRKTRASSVSQFEFQPKIIDSPSVDRRTRASSVPKTVSITQSAEELSNTPARRRSRRLSQLDDTSSHPVTPKEQTTPQRMLRSRTTPNRDTLDSPISQNLRSKSITKDSPPTSSVNLSFKGSKESLESPVSRKRTRRGNKDNEDSVSVASSQSTKSVRSTRSATKNLLAKIASGDYDDDEDDRQSTVSNISNRSLTLRSRKKALAVISEDQPMQSVDDDYSMSRR